MSRKFFNMGGCGREYSSLSVDRVNPVALGVGGPGVVLHVLDEEGASRGVVLDGEQVTKLIESLTPYARPIADREPKWLDL